MALSIKKQAESLLIKNEYKSITELEMADYIGFNDKEKTMLKLFWDSAFNESMIYLSDELILNHLTDENKKDAITHFIKRILIPNFKENEDYQIIDKTHALVVNSYSPNLANRNLKETSNRKRYYAITGTCFKELLMLSRSEKGLETRKYFLPSLAKNFVFSSGRLIFIIKKFEFYVGYLPNIYYRLS